MQPYETMNQEKKIFKMVGWPVEIQNGGRPLRFKMEDGPWDSKCRTMKNPLRFKMGEGLWDSKWRMAFEIQNVGMARWENPSWRFVLSLMKNRKYVRAEEMKIWKPCIPSHGLQMKMKKWWRKFSKLRKLNDVAEMSADFRQLSQLAKNVKSQAVNLSRKKKDSSKFSMQNISKWMCEDFANWVTVRKNRAENENP